MLFTKLEWPFLCRNNKPQEHVVQLWENQQNETINQVLIIQNNLVFTIKTLHFMQLIQTLNRCYYFLYIPYNLPTGASVC